MGNLIYRYLLLGIFAMLLVKPAHAQGVHWIQMNAPYTGSIPSNLIESDGKTLFAATKNGLFTTIDDGVTWTPVSGTPGKTEVFQFAFRDSTWFAITSPHNITDAQMLNRSTNSGAKWDSLVIGVGYLLANKKGLLFAITELQPSTLRSLDDGNTWDIVDSGDGASGSRRQLDILALDDNYVIASLDSSGESSLVVSTDFCSSWRKGTLIDGVIGIDGNTFLSCTKNGIFRSVDTGLTWQLINPDIQNVSFLVTNNIIYAYSDSLGFLFSLNHGYSWTAMNNGLPNFNFRNITIGKDEIYAGLASGELYRTSFPSSVNVPGASAALQLSIYPNPISSSAEFSYSIPVAGIISLTVYDALGRIITTPIAEEMQDIGEHKISIGMQSLSPGFYHCLLSANGKEAFTKFVIIR